MNTFPDDPDTVVASSSTIEPTLAVLPFANASADPGQDFFCEGMAAELIIALARIPGLHLVARSALFSLTAQEASRDVRSLGRRLQATAVLDGALRRADGQLGLWVKLVDVASGRALWTCRFDRPVQDVFHVLDEIVAGTTRGLEVYLPPDLERKIQRIHTSDVEAYECYVRGRRAYYQFNRQGVETACDHFRRALAIDVTYALAYCGLADCYAYQYMYVDSDRDHLRRAEEAGRRALDLDPELAEAHASCGMVWSLSGHFEEASTAFERAIALDPKLYEAWFLYGRVCFAHGNLEQAARLFAEANRAWPEDYQSLLLAGQVYDDLGDDERARRLRRRGVDTAVKHLSLQPGTARAWYMGANGLVTLEQTDEGLAWLQKALALEPDDPMLLYNAGCIYALVGETEQALGCLERAVAGGLRQRGWFVHDSNLDSLRVHPRFQALLDWLV